MHDTEAASIAMIQPQDVSSSQGFFFHQQLHKCHNSPLQPTWSVGWDTFKADFQQFPCLKNLNGISPWSTRPMLQVTTICANVARRGSSPNPNPSLPLSQMYNQTTLFDASNYVNNVLIQEGPLEKDFTKHVFLKNIWMWTCSTNPRCEAGPRTYFLCAHRSGSKPRWTPQISAHDEWIAGFGIHVLNASFHIHTRTYQSLCFIS